jgi:uncharacterized protein YgbK (DUF1537 family)
LETVRQGAPSITAFIHSHNNNGTQIFVADAVDDTDLETIYIASTGLEKPHILTGSAGLANQLAKNKWGNGGNDERSESRGRLRTMPSKEEFFFSKMKRNRGIIISKQPTNPFITGSIHNPQIPTLIIAGSRQKETAEQILALSQSLSIQIIRFKVSLVMEGKCDEAVQDAYVQAAELMQRNIPVCLIAVESMFHDEAENQHYVESDEWGKTISGALGILTKKLFDDFRFSLLITTGGDTSMGICQHLEIQGIEPLKEICPGIPLARIVGGAYHGRFIITKSGRFGETNALLKIFDFFNER